MNSAPSALVFDDALLVLDGSDRRYSMARVTCSIVWPTLIHCAADIFHCVANHYCRPVAIAGPPLFHSIADTMRHCVRGGVDGSDNEELAWIIR
jgi:hypothetical protein